jgi:Family of unknown function (DUF6232)
VDEKTFFSSDGVTVTNARFLVDGQTFSMSNVTSVKAMEKKPNRLRPIGFSILGLIALANAAHSGEALYVFLGLILAVVGIVWYTKQHTIYHVMLHTSGGETSALKTHQRKYLDSVMNALNTAIVYRG